MFISCFEYECSLLMDCKRFVVDGWIAKIVDGWIAKILKNLKSTR